MRLPPVEELSKKRRLRHKDFIPTNPWGVRIRDNAYLPLYRLDVLVRLFGNY